MGIAYEMGVVGGVLCVKASGYDESAEQVKRYGLAVIEAAVAHGVTRILCNEVQLRYSLGTFSTYEVAEFIAAAASSVVRVAIVCDPKCLREGEFWETVAVNRGLCVRVLTDLEEAQAWLDKFD